MVDEVVRGRNKKGLGNWSVEMKVKKCVYIQYGKLEESN